MIGTKTNIYSVKHHSLVGQTTLRKKSVSQRIEFGWSE